MKKKKKREKGEGEGRRGIRRKETIRETLGLVGPEERKIEQKSQPIVSKNTRVRGVEKKR